MNNNSATLHGVFMNVHGTGTLLTGKSGIGKSELALVLINRGHQLIADDAILFSKNQHQKVIGQSPCVLKDFLEVRGLGILNIREMFGDDTIAEQAQLELIVDITLFNQQDLYKLDRLHGQHRNYNVLGDPIPEVTIPVTPGRNLAILVEGAVKNQQLRNSGYIASDEFIKRQQQIMSDT